MAKREKYGPDIEIATVDEMTMVKEVFGDDAEMADAEMHED